MATLRDLLYTMLLTCAVLGALLLGSTFALFGAGLIAWAAGVAGAYRWAEVAHQRRMQALTAAPQAAPQAATEAADEATADANEETGESEEQRLIA